MDTEDDLYPLTMFLVADDDRKDDTDIIMQSAKITNTLKNIPCKESE